MTQPENKRLYRSRDQRMIVGVCGGLGEYFGIDPTLVRLAFVAGLFLIPTSTFWIYIVMALIVPEEGAGPTDILPPSNPPQA
ncbi:MAG TPA: PspC domain-containing protein [Anaerolineaceae bacterium]|nr:PspC domain-containing protein [Anaerolineaceae bacterium]